MEITDLQEKSIVFIGFMGVGKTTIGRAVAHKLQREFIDIDEKIEQKFQMPTTDIFTIYGEKTFRDYERKLITKYSKEKNKVISVGGGAFLQEEIKETCLSNCIVLFLTISWSAWQQRIPLIYDTRPVLHGKTLDEMKELFDRRQSIYADHHLKINTDLRGIEEVAEMITNQLIVDFSDQYLHQYE